MQKRLLFAASFIAICIYFFILFSGSDLSKFPVPARTDLQLENTTAVFPVSAYIELKAESGPCASFSLISPPAEEPCASIAKLFNDLFSDNRKEIADAFRLPQTVATPASSGNQGEDEKTETAFNEQLFQGMKQAFRDFSLDSEIKVPFQICLGSRHVYAIEMKNPATGKEKVANVSFVEKPDGSQIFDFSLSALSNLVGIMVINHTKLTQSFPPVPNLDDYTRVALNWENEKQEVAFLYVKVLVPSGDRVICKDGQFLDGKITTGDQEADKALAYHRTFIKALLDVPRTQDYEKSPEMKTLLSMVSPRSADSVANNYFGVFPAEYRKNNPVFTHRDVVFVIDANPLYFIYRTSDESIDKSPHDYDMVYRDENGQMHIVNQFFEDSFANLINSEKVRDRIWSTVKGKLDN